MQIYINEILNNVSRLCFKIYQQFVTYKLKKYIIHFSCEQVTAPLAQNNLFK